MSETIDLNDLTGTEAVIATATRAARPAALDERSRFYSIVSPSGEVKVIDLEARRTELLDAPRRKTGTYSVHDADSFMAYLLKHGDDQSEVWADTTRNLITGVLDAHRDSESAAGTHARHEDHRVQYGVILTDAWRAWAANDGRLLDQVDFAEHLEDRSLDIIEPSAADMLEIAQTFHATTGVTFDSSTRLSSGERQLTYREQIDATAGRTKQLEIPEKFKLAIRPFEGATPFGVTARLRYRIVQGHLKIGYKLERPADVLRESFLEVVSTVQASIVEANLDIPVLRGTR